MSRHVGGARLAGLLAFLLLLIATPGAALAAPQAPDVQGQSIRAGHLRVQVLTATLLRLEYAADDTFENRPTFNAVDRNPGRTWFTATTRNGELRVRTSAVTLRYRLDSGPVLPENTTLELRVGGRATSVHPAFGSPTRDDALGGWYRGMDFYDGQAGPAEQIDLHPGMLNRGGWYLLDDTRTAVRARTTTGLRRARRAPAPIRTATCSDTATTIGVGWPTCVRSPARPCSPRSGRSAPGSRSTRRIAPRTTSRAAARLPREPRPAGLARRRHRLEGAEQVGRLELEPGPVPEPAALPRLGQGPGASTATLNVHAAISGDDPRFAAGAGHREGQARARRRAASRRTRTASTGPTLTRPPRTMAAPAVRGPGRPAVVAGLLLRRQHRRARPG